MVNAEQLEDLLCTQQFDILVHGHRHLPRFRTHSIDGYPDVAMLCSGSFSVQIDTRWAGSVNNQFHLIQIEDRDPAEQLIKGCVQSWTYYYNRGWEPSNELYSGIPHLEKFGTYTNPVVLAKLLHQIIQEKLQAKEFIKWSSIIEQHKDLRHLRWSAIQAALKSLENTLNFDAQGETEEKLILLKREVQ